MGGAKARLVRCPGLPWGVKPCAHYGALRSQYHTVRRLPRVVWLLGLASLLNDMSSELVGALLPLYLAELSVGGIGVGLIGGAEDAMRSLLSVVSGHLSDRIGKRRPFLFAGYGISALAKGAIAATGSWAQVLGLRLVDRSGKAIRTPPRDALLADATPQALRGLAFGVHRSMDSLGAVGGALAAFVTVGLLGLADLRLAILVGGLAGFASLLPLLFVREGSGEGSVGGTRPAFRGGLARLPVRFRRTLVGLALFAGGNLSYLFFLLAVNRSYTDRLAVGVPLAMFLLFQTTYAVLAVPFGRLSDLWGRKQVVVLGFVSFAVVSLGFVVSAATPWFAALFILYDAAVAAVEGNQRALVADLVPADQRGLALGLFHTVVGLCALAGNVMAGVLAQFVGPTAPFVWAAGLTSTGALVLGLSLRDGPAGAGRAAGPRRPG